MLVLLPAPPNRRGFSITFIADGNRCRGGRRSGDRIYSGGQMDGLAILKMLPQTCRQAKAQHMLIDHWGVGLCAES